MRLLVTLAVTLALGACATSSVESGATVGNVANYDALKQARDACVKQGGEIVQRPQSSGKRLADFVCKGK